MNKNKAAIYRAISITNAANNTRQPDAIRAAASELLESASAIRPGLPHDDPVESFRSRISSDKIAGTVESVAAIDLLPEAVEHYCSLHKLSNTVALQPSRELLNLNWDAFRIKHHADSDECIAVTMGMWGIAETGSVVISSAADSPALLNFLPSHHILVLFEKNILVNLEDYAVKISSLNQQRLVCLITGASGTTDIEGVLVNGAHGPEHLHIILIKNGN